MALDSQSRSAELFERAKRVMPGGNTRTTVFRSPHPAYARSGRGCRVTDVDGVERIDFINNYTSLIHGHAHPRIVEAVTKQLQEGTAFAFPTESEIELAELLCARQPAFERIRFTNSGTEAVMTAIKAARAYTGRPKIAKCEGAYHGAYDYVEVSLDPSPDTWGDDVPRPVPYARGTPEGVLKDTVVIPFNDGEAAERIVSAHGDELAAIIVDPLPNRAGLMPARPEFLAALRRVADRVGALIIADEVISFRLGPGGTRDVFPIEAELTTLAKIIGGGFPVGAVAGRADVMAVFDPTGGKPLLPHSGTFNANPVTMVAGKVAMDMMTPDEYERLNRLGARARQGMNEAFRIAGVPGQVTGEGSLFRIHVTDRELRDYRSTYATPEERRRMDALYRGLFHRGIVVGTNGLGALSTPMGEQEIDQLCEALLGALREVARTEP